MNNKLPLSLKFKELITTNRKARLLLFIITYLLMLSLIPEAFIYDVVIMIASLKITAVGVIELMGLVLCLILIPWLCVWRITYDRLISNRQYYSYLSLITFFILVFLLYLLNKGAFIIINNIPALAQTNLPLTGIIALIDFIAIWCHIWYFDIKK